MTLQAKAAVLVLLAGTTVGLALAHSRQEKPTHVSIDNIYYNAPPPSLSEMEKTADAVVFGRVLGGVSKDGGFFRKSEPGITTSYRFKVHEVISAQGKRAVDPNELTVLRDGGSIDRGNRIDKVVDADFPPFELGHEYVLFLRWDAGQEAWVPAWGPNATFEIKGGLITSPGYAHVCKEQNGLSIDEFLEKLRRLPCYCRLSSAAYGLLSCLRLSGPRFYWSRSQ